MTWDPYSHYFLAVSWDCNLAPNGLFFQCHIRCELVGYKVAYRVIGSVYVIIPILSREYGASLSKRREQSLIHAVFTEAAVKAFDKSVLHRYAGSHIMLLDIGLLAPLEDRHADLLRAVAGFDHLRLFPYGDNLVQQRRRDGCPTAMYRQRGTGIRG